MQRLSFLVVLMSSIAACATGTYLSEPPSLDTAGENYPSDSIAFPLRPLGLHPNSPMRRLPEMQVLLDWPERIKAQ